MKKLVLLFTLLSINFLFGFPALKSGTHRIKHKTEQQVFDLHIQKKGYVQIIKNSPDCGDLFFLSSLNQNLYQSFATNRIQNSMINVLAVKGTYRIQLLTRKDCTLNIVLP